MPHKKTIESAVKKIVERIDRLEGLSSTERQLVIGRFNEALHRLFPPAQRMAGNPDLASQLRVEMAVVQMIASLEVLDGLSFEAQVEALAEIKEVLGTVER
ncbi:MAG: hypothetical protein HQL37_08260 [Alphaproteobacteria bacterium]|nr:hypothetical protein [Alphaproteobacteria bacterium]